MSGPVIMYCGECAKLVAEKLMCWHKLPNGRAIHICVDCSNRITAKELKPKNKALPVTSLPTRTVRVSDNKTVVHTPAPSKVRPVPIVVEI